MNKISVITPPQESYQGGILLFSGERFFYSLKKQKLFTIQQQKILHDKLHSAGSSLETLSFGLLQEQLPRIAIPYAVSNLLRRGHTGKAVFRF